MPKTENTPRRENTPEKQQKVYQTVAFLLQYPGSDWENGLEIITEALPELPAESQIGIKNFLDWAKQVGSDQVAQNYVETFDQRRRCCLELSYYTTGDTRQRGIALTIFQDLYAAVGWQITGENLPDYLPYLLELAAATSGDNQTLVQNLIATHRSGIEVLEQSLLQLQSPWAWVIAALQTVLPAVDAATEARMLELIKTGPPAELVGRNTYGQDARQVLLSSAAALAATMTAKPEVRK